MKLAAKKNASAKAGNVKGMNKSKFDYWLNLRKKFTNHEDLNHHIARRLRELADQVESGNYPSVFFWYDGEMNGEYNQMISMAHFELTLSHPWPG